MKSSFLGYYAPSPSEYEKLWKEGLVVLDANVLLNFYRWPAVARDEVFDLLGQLKDRLWIPHQVALEFQRNRLSVIANERKVIDDALTTANQRIEQIKSRVLNLEIEKRGLELESSAVITSLDEAHCKVIDIISKTRDAQLDISADDPIRDRLDSLFAGRVGPAPKDQAEVDAIDKEGEERFKEKVPPGFMDVDKEKDPNRATFMFDDVKYQRKFGDLFLWKQIIAYVSSNGIKDVLLITSDRSEDWWWKENGKTLGPHPHIVREILRTGAVELFWMYTSEQFVEQSKLYFAGSISDNSINEIKQLKSSSVSVDLQMQEGAGVKGNSFSDDNYPSRVDYSQIDDAVAKWLLSQGGELVVTSADFPDFVVEKEDQVNGYEVRYLRNFEKMLFPPAVVNSMLRGYYEVNEGRLSTFSNVLVIPEIDALRIRNEDMMSELRTRVRRLAERYNIDGLIIGSVSGSNFTPLLQYRKSFAD